MCARRRRRIPAAPVNTMAERLRRRASAQPEILRSAAGRGAAAGRSWCPAPIQIRPRWDGVSPHRRRGSASKQEILLAPRPMPRPALRPDGLRQAGGGRTPGRNPGAGFLLGMGGPVLHDAVGASGRRSNPGGKRQAAVTSTAVFRRLPTGKSGLNRGGSFNQWNQGKRSIAAGPRQTRSGRNRLRTGAPLRPGHGELRSRRDRADGARLRALRAGQARHDHVLAVGLWTDRSAKSHASATAR